MKVMIEPYNLEWPLKFSEIQEQLSVILKNVDIISIEHVGSTSIPSLMAKPVLDIDIITPASSLEAARSALKNANYTDCGEMNVSGRFAFRQPGYGKLDVAHGKGKDGELRYNTYVMIQGYVALRNHLDTKRVLLGNKDLREEYASVKNKLKETEFDNIGQYASGKTEILCKILRTARWNEEDLDPVIKANS